MTALPQLTQNVAFQGGNYQRNLGNAALALSGRNSSDVKYEHGISKYDDR
jgi:hypothetical protein